MVQARDSIAAIFRVLTFFGPLQASGADKIQDNSFFLEEAYNQEPGVIQHIQTLEMERGGSWEYTFTEEWPVPREAHQLSFTLPVLNTGTSLKATSIGDILLNYRLQLVLTHPVAISPRISLLLPSGDFERGSGKGSLGIQANIPLSVDLSDRWVTHWNLGLTYLPAHRVSGGGSAETIDINFGAGFIFCLSKNFNLLLEAGGESLESPVSDGTMVRSEEFFLLPGVRFAMNFRSGLQIVPGLGFPLILTQSGIDYAGFLYLSFEHPLF